MDIGVADESLNGIPYEESSESEEEVEEEETEGKEFYLEINLSFFINMFKGNKLK